MNFILFAIFFVDIQSDFMIMIIDISVLKEDHLSY
jgi:hypothetical protein